jgi:hypothetical protein
VVSPPIPQFEEGDWIFVKQLSEDWSVIHIMYVGLCDSVVIISLQQIAQARWEGWHSESSYRKNIGD